MSIYRMNDKKTHYFIELYRNEACLWCPQDPNYKNREARLLAAERIVYKLDIEGFGVPEVIQKFKNLRSAYCQELKKIQKGANFGQAYTPTVAWFELMDGFLRPFIQHRKEDYDNLKSEPENFEQCEDNENPDNYANGADSANDYYNPMLNVRAELTEGTSTIKTHGHRKRKYPDNSNADRNPFDPMSLLIEKIREGQQYAARLHTESSYELFAKYIVSQLQELPRANAINVQRNIHNILADEQLSVLRNT